jgi:uracil phosphoribosyltransferase
LPVITSQAADWGMFDKLEGGSHDSSLDVSSVNFLKVKSMKSTFEKNVCVVTHPLVQHKLTLMRDKNTSSSSFRTLLTEISTLMAYEVTSDLAMQDIEIETPLEKMTSKVIDGKKLVFVSILRAGNGILDGMLSVVPNARVGHIGLYRDPKTLMAIEYYFKLPDNLNERDVILIDPMLATGHSAVAAIERIKQLRPRSIKFVCLVSCPQGIQAVHQQFPEVMIYTAAIDRQLNEKAYILPGLGDAGDRIFGTK